MNHSGERVALLLLTTALEFSCSNPEGVAEFEARLEANITGDVVVHYSGNAIFHTEKAGNDGRPVFGLHSANRDGNIGLPTDGYQAIGFQAFRSLSDVGEHDVATWDLTLADTTKTWVAYVRAVNGEVESYASVSGAIDITRSSHDRLDGDFVVEAVLYCRRSQDPDVLPQDPCDLNNLDPTRGEITVVGDFIAERLKIGTVINDHLTK